MSSNQVFKPTDAENQNSLANYNAKQTANSGSIIAI